MVSVSLLVSFFPSYVHSKDIFAQDCYNVYSHPWAA